MTKWSQSFALETGTQRTIFVFINDCELCAEHKDRCPILQKVHACVYICICENVLLPINMARYVVKLSILIINYAKLMIQIDNVTTQRARVFGKRTFSYIYSENIFIHIPHFHIHRTFPYTTRIFVQTDIHIYMHTRMLIMSDYYYMRLILCGRQRTPINIPAEPMYKIITA